MPTKIFDWRLKSCKACRKVWQNSTPCVDPYNNRGGESYYTDFPHYGLDKVTCPRCEEEPNVVNA